MPTLRLVHTNDFHNRLTDEGSARLQAILSANNSMPMLYIDAGDAIKAGNMGVSPSGEPILTRMEELGCVAMTLGNREFHISRLVLEKKIADARFPVLCANIRSKIPGKSVPTVPFIRLNIGGTRISVFGLTVPMVTERMAARHLSDFVFDDPIVTAQKMVAELRESADILIALTHIGLRADERLAQNVEGIDLIVGGHTHAVLESPQREFGTPILQAGSHARYVGDATLTWEPGKSLRVESTLHVLQKQKERP